MICCQSRFIASILSNGWNTRAISNSGKEFETIVSREYEEYVKFVNMQSNFNQDVRTITLSNGENLEKLPKAQKENVEAFKGLEKTLSKLQDFSLGNRLVLNFYVDVTSIQRILMALMQNNSIKTRLLESFALLERGILPKDFIQEKNLKDILGEAKKYLGEDRKFAFIADNLEIYYKLPLSNSLTKNNETYIEVRIPVVNKCRETSDFEMLYLRNHPVTCWNASI